MSADLWPRFFESNGGLARVPNKGRYLLGRALHGGRRAGFLNHTLFLLRVDLHRLYGRSLAAFKTGCAPAFRKSRQILKESISNPVRFPSEFIILAI